MGKLIFTAEDFHSFEGNRIEAANEKFALWEADQPTIYGRNDRWSLKREIGNTHSAKIFNIEKLKREPCRHPKEFLQHQSVHPNSAQCIICGKELFAEWKEISDEIK